MPSIQSLDHPLVFKADPGRVAMQLPPHADGEIATCLQARALVGMQKEAVVRHGPSNTVWRMVCDEGPYLNGTDLAPFPLGFFAAGMAFSMLGEITRHAEARGIKITGLRVVQDNFYTMEGSALRGDMLGGARPVEMTVHAAADASRESLLGIVRLAEASSPAQAYMRDVLQNTFALCHNGCAVDVTAVHSSPMPLHEDPGPHFEGVALRHPADFLPHIITKLEPAEVVEGVEGGAGSSLKCEQKRTLHVHSVAVRRDDGISEAEIRLYKPLGSAFRFIADERGQMAPPDLAYLSAGVGFCYLTQLGRYAHIVKMGVHSYRIVMDSVFRHSGSAEDKNARVEAKPVDTHVFVNSGESVEAARQLVKMGERTCFLHAAMRSANPTRLYAAINEELVALTA